MTNKPIYDYLDDYAEFDSQTFKTGTDFEIYCAELLVRNDFEDVFISPKSYDRGADIFANKDGKSYVFQCKLRNTSDKVGRSAVQEIFTAKALYKADVAVIMTNTPKLASSAALDARQLNVELWTEPYLRILSNV